MKTTYKRPTTSSGDLRTPIEFYRMTKNLDGEPGQMPTQPLFKCLAQVYGSSNKDTAILEAHGVKRGVTVKMRDTRGGYIPKNNDGVVVDDYRYKSANGDSIVWNVVDIRPDFEDDRFIVVVLGESE